MSFSLDFIALNFSSPLRTVYRYRLENFDDKWITTGLDEGAGVRRVFLPPNLPPNRYRFVVSASTGGEQFGEEAVVEILVLPPWWMARAMVVAYGVLALLAVAGGGLWLRRRIGRAHREQIASITRKNKLDLLEAKVCQPLHGGGQRSTYARRADCRARRRDRQARRGFARAP